jgi:hypothetical protein
MIASPISCRVLDARFLKTFEAESAAIALAASAALIVGIVTAQGQAIIHPQSNPLADNLRFCPLQQRGV